MTEATTDVMSRLRNETRAEHTLAENSPLEKALVQGRLPRPVFAEYLAQRYVLHAALEPAVWELCALQSRLQGLLADELRQLPNLAADLAFFERGVNAIQPLPAAKSFADGVRERHARQNLELLGVFYVFEGSKNGARFIARAVGPALGLRSGTGLAYLDPHGERQRPLWQAFRERMNAVGFEPAEADLLVRGAKWAFSSVHEIDQQLWAANE